MDSRRRLSLPALGFIAAFSASVAALAPLTPSARADLDRIDADGVTETGGDPRYARMLPRTGADGLLSASLLPPVADWASQPIARLYYMSASAATQGNGAPQYPFNTITYALSHMAANSALLVAPGTYTGSGTVAAGVSTTLFGLGRQSYVENLTITANGSSASTALVLHGLRVGTLQILGGRINVYMSGTTIGMLNGSASSVTITRMDLGSRITAATVAYTDVYAGYPVVPMADALVEQDTGVQLVVEDGRGVLVDGGSTSTLARMEDIASATGAVYTAISGLSARDAELAGLVSAESTARAAGDNTLSNRIETAVADLTADFGSLGATWGTQVSLINSRLTELDAALSALSALEGSDVATINATLTSVQTGYVAADTALASTLRGEILAGDNTIRSELPATIDTRAASVADARIAASSNAIVASAVAQADALDASRAATINTRIDGVQGGVTALQATTATHWTSLTNLSARVTSLQSRVSSLESTVGSHTTTIAALNSSLTSLNSWRTTMNSWKSQTNADMGTIRNRINAVIDTLGAITNATHTSGINLPDKF